MSGPDCLWRVCIGVSEGATLWEEGNAYFVCKLVLTLPELLVPPPPSLIASLVLIEGLSHASALAVWSELPPPGRDKPLPLPLPSPLLPHCPGIVHLDPLTFLGTFLPPSGAGPIKLFPSPQCQRLERRQVWEGEPRASSLRRCPERGDFTAGG